MWLTGGVLYWEAKVEHSMHQDSSLCASIALEVPTEVQALSLPKMVIYHKDDMDLIFH